MAKSLVRLACAALLAGSLVGCKATGPDGVREKKAGNDFLDPAAGVPSQSPFQPYPLQ
jgi:hypothetical protein